MLLDNAEQVAEVARWLCAVEGEHFEFKEAKEKLGFDELWKCASAPANGGGGKIIFEIGRTRRRTRRRHTGRHTPAHAGTA